MVENKKEKSDCLEVVSVDSVCFAICLACLLDPLHV